MPPNFACCVPPMGFPDSTFLIRLLKIPEIPPPPTLPTGVVDLELEAAVPLAEL